VIVKGLSKPRSEVDESEVREAVERLVAAFGEGRLDDYFSAFHPDSSFVFYTADQRLESVADYRALWERWVKEDGFAVLDCRTSDTRVQLWGDVAVVSYSVRTSVRSRGQESVVDERETIVLARQADGRWLGVHEHLSPYQAR
jgi:ketosteroid isomerase-like protein